MLGTVTTITAIAFGQMINNPSSKDGKWAFASDNPTTSQINNLQTNKPIMDNFLSKSETLCAGFASYDRAISRLEWLSSELDSYMNLKAGWDGIGSLSADPTHISAAKALLNVLPAGLSLPKTMLSSDGELGLYWKDDNLFADAVIENEKTFSLFIRFNEKNSREIFIESIDIDSAASEIIKNSFLMTQPG